MLVGEEVDTRSRKIRFTDTRFIDMRSGVSIDLEKNDKVSVEKI